MFIFIGFILILFLTKNQTLKNVIKINNKSSEPKYRQIIDSLCCAIENGSLKKGDKIPSINQICTEFNLSRDTVIYAYSELKSKGIILSQPGKGYYLATSETNRNEKVFVLFDELNAFKEELYYALISTLKGRAHVEVFFHHNNFKLFNNLLLECAGNYTSYIIMPATFENTGPLLSKLSQNRIFILDRLKADLKEFQGVYQDFEMDVFEAMTSGIAMLNKYRKLVFLNSGGKEPIERVRGFEKFCQLNNIEYQILKNIENARPALYEAWFLTSDRDLVHLVKMAKEYKFKLGKKFGIVSFNDTMLKEVVAGGITTISTDFNEMGKTLANMILNHKFGMIRNPSRLIIRKSL
jgi:DNA-binding transcriptional regulator YhcF (GntR family)